MSAPTATPSDAPKKKGKLPIILALALVLGGGGFFMMKGKGKKDAPKTSLVLAEKEVELEEFLTNTRDTGTYVRAKISVKTTKEYTEDKLKANMGDVRDAVLGVFNATPSAELTDASKRGALKKKLAEAMNTALEGTLVDKKADDKDDAPKRKGKATEKPVEAASDDWDSKSGPILQVRFEALATQ